MFYWKESPLKSMPLKWLSTIVPKSPLFPRFSALLHYHGGGSPWSLGQDLPRLRSRHWRQMIQRHGFGFRKPGSWSMAKHVDWFDVGAVGNYWTNKSWLTDSKMDLPFFEIRMLRRNVLETLWLHLTAIFLSPSFHIPCIGEVMPAKAKLSHQDMISSFQHFLPSSSRLATVAWIWILCRLLIYLLFMPLIPASPWIRQSIIGSCAEPHFFFDRSSTSI